MLTANMNIVDTLLLFSVDTPNEFISENFGESDDGI